MLQAFAVNILNKYLNNRTFIERDNMIINKKIKFFPRNEHKKGK